MKTKQGKECCELCKGKKRLTKKNVYVCFDILCSCHTPPKDTWVERFDDEFNFLFKDENAVVFASRHRIKSFIQNLLQEQKHTLIGEVEEEIKKEKISGKPKKYDGNNLKSVMGVYPMSANSWEEVIRYEDGHDAALSTCLSLLAKVKEK